MTRAVKAAGAFVALAMVAALAFVLADFLLARDLEKAGRAFAPIVHKMRTINAPSDLHLAVPVTRGDSQVAIVTGRFVFETSAGDTVMLYHAGGRLSNEAQSASLDSSIVALIASDADTEIRFVPRDSLPPEKMFAGYLFLSPDKAIQIFRTPRVAKQRDD